MAEATSTDAPTRRGPWRDLPTWRRVAWAGLGAALVGLSAALALAGGTRPEGALAGAPRTAGVCLYLAVGAAYLAAAALLPRRGHSPRTLVWVLLIAAGMRAPMWLAPPAAHADYNRYLWDGALVANGRNPYRLSPRRAAQADLDDAKILSLARAGREVLAEVNHPKLRTVYPPFAQALFAAAYWLTPFDVTGWRVVLLAFDVLAAAMVISLLRAAGRPAAWALVYLWNPLMVVETYLFAHVDLVAAALVIAFAWALWRGRTVLAALALAAAVGAKLWPAILAGFLVRAEWRRPRRLALAGGLFAVSLAAMAIPFSAAFGGADSGMTAYAKTWQGEMGAYAFFDEAGWWLWRKCPLGVDGRYLGRGLMMLVLLVPAVWLAAAKAQTAHALCRRVTLVILAMLLLAPTVWPWYYVAVIPLAAVAPAAALLAWTLLLPLMYLPRSALPGGALMWIVHLPVWALLAGECLAGWVRRRRAANLPAAPAGGRDAPLQ